MKSADNSCPEGQLVWV